MISSMLFFMNFIYPSIMQFIIILLMTIPPKKNNFHPINLMTILIMITMIMTLKMNFLMKSWTPFILFLIMIGGLLIILIYIISLTNNNYSKLNINNMMSIMLKTLISLILITNLTLNSPLVPTMNSKFLIFNYNSMTMSNMFNYNFMFTLFMMIYLLFSMLCIMNICMKFKSPIRQLLLYD